ncbi:hypothetical protein N7491_006421 [Penicillium cf. griseofulvum]|uniref:Glycosyltransferase family 31 protein n=1 Tax=Penicillium cf. griseofulvum TaxID=2972120 RepID=A0A9W9M1N7_9EURO|nr:hypothetical protein N7472_010548 [Penicillium cf. griseofulvum]KAJ5429405.1 hypothetical protein N7491_006421 [Penicillium cf. griseofulvum]KAJ5436813.1 hypothetical protein N7445_007698 [Penicillium cf. griseofulvum]
MIAPELCANFPTHLLDRIQVILKTGAGEPEKNKAHLATVTSCITNLIVVSDHDETIGPHHFIDVLDHLPPEYTSDNPDFATYHAQKQAHSQGESVGYSQEGWRLDRFKFLPMVEKAYEMRPHADWYVFIEADVYYFWDTLFRTLDQLDPSMMHYIGSPVPGSRGRSFAYGGAGFVLSTGVMKRLVGDSSSDSRLSVKYMDWSKKDCCGDAVLAYAILDKTGVKLEGLYPTFAGDDIASLKVNKERWCVPLLALHRMTPEQTTELWKWERTRPYNEKPCLHSSLLAYTHSHLRDGPTRDFWDNYSDITRPENSPDHSSAAACSTACAADLDCLQFSYSSKQCRFGNSIQMGKPTLDNQDFISGWDMEKMSNLGFRMDTDFSDSCREASWLKPTIQ